MAEAAAGSYLQAKAAPLDAPVWYPGLFPVLSQVRPALVGVRPPIRNFLFFYLGPAEERPCETLTGSTRTLWQWGIWRL